MLFNNHSIFGQFGFLSELRNKAEVMLRRRKEDMEFYKLFASDKAFETALTHSTQRYAETMVE